MAHAALITKARHHGQRIAAGPNVDSGGLGFISRGKRTANDRSYSSCAQVAAVAMDDLSIAQFQPDRQFQVCSAIHPKILQTFWRGFDDEVVRAGKVPIVRDVADGAYDIEGHIELAGAAGRQRLAPDDHDIMRVPMPYPVMDQVDAGNRSQITRA